MNARVAAPELSSALEWVNTDEAPTLAALRGRVVLLNLWSFDSVNCTNALPDIRFLENKYHDGLSVVGVHTPKYEYQRSAAPVLKAVNRNHIRHFPATQELLQDLKVNKGRRTNMHPVGTGRTIADHVETQITARGFQMA